MLVQRVLSLSLAAVLGTLVTPWVAQRVWQTIQSSLEQLPTHPEACAIGAGIGAALILWRKPNRLVHTLIHEACHAILCMVLLVPVRGFQASDGQGGQVAHDKTDPLRTILICLAPYTLPLLLAPALLLSYALEDDQGRKILSGVIAFLYLHHLQGLGRNVRINFWGKQADISKAGKVLSLVTIATVLMLVTDWTLRVLWP